jgi:DNA mismatch repair protein MSH6
VSLSRILCKCNTDHSCRLAPVDAILTRMGAYDNMFSNSSTFKVELDECCKIIRDATPRSLVILDELGRGTSTFDGIAIAGAVLHHLATHTLALSCFATHYSSLTNDYKYHPNIRTMHMATAIDEEKREVGMILSHTYGFTEPSLAHLAVQTGRRCCAILFRNTCGELGRRPREHC